MLAASKGSTEEETRNARLHLRGAVLPRGADIRGGQGRGGAPLQMHYESMMTVNTVVELRQKTADPPVCVLSTSHRVKACMNDNHMHSFVKPLLPKLPFSMHAFVQQIWGHASCCVLSGCCCYYL